jgi:hypothetical protein
MDTDRSKRSVLFLRCHENLRERLAAAAVGQDWPWRCLPARVPEDEA